MFNLILNCSLLFIMLRNRSSRNENSREGAEVSCFWYFIGEANVAATCGSLEGFMNEISRSSDVRRYTNVTDQGRVLYQESWTCCSQVLRRCSSNGWIKYTLDSFSSFNIALSLLGSTSTSSIMLLNNSIRCLHFDTSMYYACLIIAP